MRGIIIKCQITESLLIIFKYVIWNRCYRKLPVLLFHLLFIKMVICYFPFVETVDQFIMFLSICFIFLLYYWENRCDFYALFPIFDYCLYYMLILAETIIVISIIIPYLDYYCNSNFMSKPIFGSTH